MNRIAVRITDLTRLPTALTSVPGTPEHPTGRATDHATLAVFPIVFIELATTRAADGTTECDIGRTAVRFPLSILECVRPSERTVRGNSNNSRLAMFMPLSYTTWKLSPRPQAPAAAVAWLYYFYREHTISQAALSARNTIVMNCPATC